MKFARPAKILVFEYTGFALYGLLASRGLSSPPSFGAPAMSAEPDIEKAIGEAMERLRAATGKKLPKRAVLVTPSSAGGLVHLPVDPKTPRPGPQMKEMVRWEIEDLFVRQGDLWSLGALLMGRGAISPHRRLELESGGGAGVSQREMYGEEAERQSIDDCLLIQEQMFPADEEMAIGWTPQALPDESGPFTWYGAGIDAGVLGRWRRAFEKRGLRCEAVYPQLGAALPLLARPSSMDAAREGWLFVDIRQEQFGLFQGVGERVESLSIQPCPCGALEPEDAADAVRRFRRPGVTDIYYSSDAEDSFLPAALAEALGGAEKNAVRIAPIIGERAPEEPADDCPPSVLASLRGAATRALNPKEAGAPAGIRTREPSPPLWKNRDLWPWAAILLLLAGAVGHGVYMRTRVEAAKSELNRLDIEYERRLKMIGEARSLNAESGRLQAELDALENKLKEEEQLGVFLNDVVIYRQELVPGVLEAIARAASDEVVLDAIEEKDDRSGFAIAGWTRRDTAGQRFGKRLAEMLAPWEYRVEDIRLERGTGRLGSSGFNFKASVVRTEKK